MSDPVDPTEPGHEGPPTTRRERRERERREAERRSGDEWRSGDERRVEQQDLHGDADARDGSERRSGADRRADERRGSGAVTLPGEVAEPMPENAPAKPVHPDIVPTGTTNLMIPDDRRPSRRVVVAVVAAVVVLAVVVAGAWWLTSDREPAPSAETPALIEQATTFVTVATREGDVVAGALMARDDETAVLMVPSRLVVDVAGQGRVLLAESLDTGSEAPGQAVADLLDVRVDGGWVLTLDGLVTLVDSVDGVVVDVDVPVTTSDGRINPGPDQRLDGVQAATFAGWLQQDESEAARLARVDQVLSQVLQSLPEGTNAVGSTLSSLADDSRSSFDPIELAGRVDLLAADARADRYAATVLPTTEIATGGDVAYGLDDDAVATVLAERFAGARSAADGDSSRVLVQNGDGTPGLGEQARDRLVEAGFRYVGGGNASTLGQQETVVAIQEDTPEARTQGMAVAEALGLGDDVLAVGLESPTLADIIVVLGADFATVAESDD